MNLSVAFLVPYLLLCAWLYLRAPRGLFFIYPVALLIGPTIKFVVGAPIYLYDISGLLILAYVLRRGGLGAWPRNIPPWHWFSLGLLVIAGLAVPAFRYGPTLASVWITLHATLSFLQILTAVALMRIPALDRERQALALGLTVALCILAVIAALEFRNPAMAGFFNQIFYRDTGGYILSDWGAKLFSTRVSGPFGNPNGLAVGGLMAAFAVWWLGRGRLSTVSFACVAVLMVATVSRQAILAAALCFAVYVLVSGRKMLGYGAVALVAIPLAAPFLGAVSFLEPIIERFSRWNSGALNDNNVSGRLIAGPQRLWAVISESPDMLFFGAGWDVQKLTNQGVDTGLYSMGFVSNSYLLWVYHAGVIGLIFILGMLLNGVSVALRLPAAERAKGLAVLLPITFLYFSDNGPILIEALIVGIAMTMGAIFATPQLAAQRRVGVRALARRMSPTAASTIDR